VSQGRGTVQAGRNYRLKEEGESITDATVKDIHTLLHQSICIQTNL